MKLLIFTYAPAGLGHLRVTDALADSRPKDSRYLVLGSIDKFITWIHRFLSLNPFGKYLFVRSQYGIFEDIFTGVYRRFLVFTSGQLFGDVNKIIESSTDTEDVWIVATHFGLAHQIGAIKDRLIKETGRNIKLIVQVTDDTSQHIWCVRGADLTFVPSLYTKEKFDVYAKEIGYDLDSTVIPYPLSPTLTTTLPRTMTRRSSSLKTDGGVVRIVIPISGAFVGLGYTTDLIKALINDCTRFVIIVLVKKSPFTRMFVRALSRIPRVEVVVGKNDLEMVNLYELIYSQNVIHLEITKPSEQAFKGIISPRRVGGSILLFTDPVGRQEIENIEFLRRHNLVIDRDTVPNYTIKQSVHQRAIILPLNPKIAALSIHEALESGLFRKMTRNFKFKKESLRSGEIGPNGAKLFWRTLLERFETKG